MNIHVRVGREHFDFRDELVGKFVGVGGSVGTRLWIGIGVRGDGVVGVGLLRLLKMLLHVVTHVKAVDRMGAHEDGRSVG